jgi:hypothetical protein
MKPAGTVALAIRALPATPSVQTEPPPVAYHSTSTSVPDGLLSINTHRPVKVHLGGKSAMTFCWPTRPLGLSGHPGIYQRVTNLPPKEDLSEVDRADKGLAAAIQIDRHIVVAALF